MVKGVHFCFFAAIFYAIIVYLPRSAGIERPIKKLIYNNNGFGAYNFEFATKDGTFRKEEGGIITKDGRGYVVRGEYGYKDPEGRQHLVREDVELRRIFESEFPQDTIRKSGVLDPEHLGRYKELESYYQNPKAKINSHFEELTCYDKEEGKMCSVDMDRYSPEEDQYYMSPNKVSHIDRRRVFCFMLLCFTEDELDRIVASF